MLQLAKEVRWSTKGIFYHGDGQDEEMKEKRKMESQLQTNPGKCFYDTDILAWKDTG